MTFREVNEQWQCWQGLCLEGLFRGLAAPRGYLFCCSHFVSLLQSERGVTFLASAKVLMPALKMELQAAGHGGQNILKENSISLHHLQAHRHHWRACSLAIVLSLAYCIDFTFYCPHAFAFIGNKGFSSKKKQTWVTESFIHCVWATPGHAARAGYLGCGCGCGCGDGDGDRDRDSVV